MTSSTTTKEKHTMRTTLGGVALLLTIAAAATGCSDPDDNTAPPASSSPAAPSTSSTPKSPEDRASAAAETTIAKYYRFRNTAGQDASFPLGRLKTVEGGTILAADQNQFRQLRQDGWKQVGDIKVTKTSVESVNLTPEKGQTPTVDISVCWDSSAVDVVDGTGTVVNAGKRTRQATTLYTVAKQPRLGWIVMVAQDQAVGSCTL
jgi:hypothetical protein